MHHLRSNLNNVDIVKKKFTCLCGSYHYIKEIFELIMIMIMIMITDIHLYLFG